MMRRKPDRPRHGGTSLEQCELDIRKYHTDNHLFTKRPSFGLQNTAFYTIKGGLSQRERPPFRFIRSLFGWLIKIFTVYCLLQIRLSVICLGGFAIRLNLL